MPKGRKPQQTISLIGNTGGAGADKKEAIDSLRKAHDSEFKLMAQDFWYWAQHAIKTEDEDQKKVRPFPVNYDYLHEVHHAMETNNKVVILKSRRLLLSWYGMLRQLYQSFFAGAIVGANRVENTADVFLGGVMSIGETEAKYLMKRIKRAYQKSPDWLKARNPMVRENELTIEFANGGTVQAFALKREGPQTFGFSEVFFDEMALQDAVRTVWTGLIPTLGAEGKLLAVSTPNGRGNLFFDIWNNKDNNYKGIERISLHWSRNPEHDQKWFDESTAGMDKQMIARMFELSFAAYFGQPVFPTWDQRIHVADETDVVDGSPMFIGHDFGFHFPAINFWQRNSRDQWMVHAEFSAFDLATEEFYEKAIAFANTFYERNRVPEIHCVPPDGLQRYRSRTLSGAINDVQTLKRMWKVPGRLVQVRVGPNEVGTRNNEGPRLKEFRTLLRLRKDGEPGLFVNKQCEMLIEGLQGGYSYPEKGDSEEPLKNEYSHLCDAAQQVPICYNRMVHVLPEEAKQVPKRPRIGGRTGL